LPRDLDHEIEINGNLDLDLVIAKITLFAVIS
jgi:hypothetical protein